MQPEQPRAEHQAYIRTRWLASGYVTVRMSLTLILLVVALFGLTPVESLDRLAVPETMWLAMWGIGLLAGAAAVKTFSPAVIDARIVKKPHDFLVEPA